MPFLTPDSCSDSGGRGAYSAVHGDPPGRPHLAEPATSARQLRRGGQPASSGESARPHALPAPLIPYMAPRMLYAMLCIFWALVPPLCWMDLRGHRISGSWLHTHTSTALPGVMPAPPPRRGSHAGWRMHARTTHTLPKLIPFPAMQCWASFRLGHINPRVSLTALREKPDECSLIVALSHPPTHPPTHPPSHLHHHTSGHHTYTTTQAAVPNLLHI